MQQPSAPIVGPGASWRTGAALKRLHRAPLGDVKTPHRHSGALTSADQRWTFNASEPPSATKGLLLLKQLFSRPATMRSNSLAEFR